MQEQSCPLLTYSLHTRSRSFLRFGEIKQANSNWMFSILYSFITFTKPYDKLKIKFYDSSDFSLTFLCFFFLWFFLVLTLKKNQPQHQAPTPTPTQGTFDPRFEYGLGLSIWHMTFNMFTRPRTIQLLSVWKLRVTGNSIPFLWSASVQTCSPEGRHFCHIHQNSHLHFLTCIK